MGRFSYLAPVLCLGSSLLFAADMQVCPDLDGDQKPDVLHVSGAIRDFHGYSYILDFEMSSGVKPRSILVHSKSAAGLRVVPRDVDGDHDIDLVIVGLLDFQPISVLFNDGDGKFRIAEATPWNWTQPRRGSFESALNHMAGGAPLTSSQSIGPVARGECPWDCPPPAAMAIPAIAPDEACFARSTSSRAPPVR